MNTSGISRRTMLSRTGILLTALAGPVLPFSYASTPRQDRDQFTFCLNTSTIKGQNLDIERQIEIAAEAGYEHIEIWVHDLNIYIERGGTTADLKNKAEDLGIQIASAISFPQWISEDPDIREKALEQAKIEMTLLAEIGCNMVAAPPAGATQNPRLDLSEVARRYRKLLEIGDSAGVIPQLELWGFSSNLHRIGEVMFVASECAHPKACILPDVYHIYKGGSDFNGLRLLDGSALHMFHMNDYPAVPQRQEINDRHRVYPGDGIAPLDNIIRILHDKNKPIILSLELFNREYWDQDPLQVAKTGLLKMKNVVKKAIE